jgi:hypothetical protein
MRYPASEKAEIIQLGECQDFRVRAGIMGEKESQYVSTQRTCDPE